MTHMPPGPYDYPAVTGDPAADWQAVRQLGHDINNLLGAVVGFAEMLVEDSPAEASYAKDLCKIRDSAERASGLVRVLMGYARNAQAVHAGGRPADTPRPPEPAD